MIRKFVATLGIALPLAGAALLAPASASASTGDEVTAQGTWVYVQSFAYNNDNDKPFVKLGCESVARAKNEQENKDRPYDCRDVPAFHSFELWREY